MQFSNPPITDSGNYRTRTAAAVREKKPGEKAAEYFKYYRIQTVGDGDGVLKRVSAGSLYAKHRAAFDRLAETFGKRGISAETYIKFFVTRLGKTERDIDSELASPITVRKFMERLQIVDGRRKIYRWFVKSAGNLADFCLENGFSSAAEGMKKIVSEGRLAQFYAGGVLSKYFLVAIPGFEKIIPKLDHFSKCELGEVLNKFDMYLTETNRSFLYVRRRTANPYEMTDALIAERRAEFNRKKEIESLFDDSLD